MFLPWFYRVIVPSKGRTNDPVALLSRNRRGIDSWNTIMSLCASYSGRGSHIRTHCTMMLRDGPLCIVLANYSSRRLAPRIDALQSYKRVVKSQLIGRPSKVRLLNALIVKDIVNFKATRCRLSAFLLSNVTFNSNNGK